MGGKKILAIAILLLFALYGVWQFWPKEDAAQQSNLLTTVKRGRFHVNVTATGELNAKRSVKIKAPQGMRMAQIYETTVSDLVREGTIVKEGDYVATLDRTELANKISNLQTEMEKIQTQLDQAKIDTAIELRGMRDELVNMGFLKKEKLLYLDQSRYEPQSVIQQAQLDMERTERDYGQLLLKYDLKKQQAVAKIQEINALQKQNQMQMSIYNQLSGEFTIMAPKSGMVIYARGWSGKVEPGSRISAWDPVVAELPDLTDMISKTYVNEVDISRVKIGQEVKLKVDAFPDNAYTGKVIKVANIGEQLRGYDAKVFEVVVQVNELDSILRPAMTTSNEILTDTYDDVLSVPIEAIQIDSLSYVYKEQNGRIIRQEVITGISNSDEIIIEHGLSEGEKIYLSLPANGADAPFEPIAADIKEKIRKKKEADRKEREAKANERKKGVENYDVPTESGGDGMFIIME
ncbi:MAG: efflux RND transporter periplasmic adaptor subunit [Saprospiraceae bacterium]|nr:efflux RND transporter periplasmic adaptor subunit [Saprospiraceae bacterium]MDZ4702431.1 efflux RND transporter periplasmic adaptor subunit [Saprospiraceae bacterium]